MSPLQSTGSLGGYSKVYFLIDHVFNYFFASFLLLMATPFFIIFPIIIKLHDRGPVFYKGERLGLNKKPFMMYKFRTMSPDAESIIGGEILSTKHNVVTPLGKFLRDTRLDELPQLFNILKGDMEFMGPRPIRPILYEKLCKNIKGYDSHFNVKPGLIGYAQLLTPHNSPKRIRSLIDNLYIAKRQRFSSDTVIVFFTIVVVLGSFYKKIIKLLQKTYATKILGKYNEKRATERKAVEHSSVFVGSISKGGQSRFSKVPSHIEDINEEAFLLYTNKRITSKSPIFKLTVEVQRKHNRIMKKSATCTGKIYKEKAIEGEYKYSYVIKYEPVSPLNAYMVFQYFLSSSMI